MQTVAYFDTAENTLNVVPPKSGGKPERSFTDVKSEAAARALLRRFGYTVTAAERYPYGRALTVTR